MQTAEQTKPAITTARKSSTVKLMVPIVRSGQTITEVQVMKPSVGDLRGLLLVEVMNMKTDALAKIFPRITVPTLMESEVYQMDIADLITMATEIGYFLTGATAPTEPE
ncbi:phage tail assembly protein [Comamonas koreensis]|jgi:Phage tail assembly chaperone proteins, E, or 41 or 14|uniref:phage tail assembly protein n=1 Tax=Comamonas koreensis TaxID=160825 RepID=UPI0015F953AD|nr:phage tail assembly protein [Comamonas koreensis]